MPVPFETEFEGVKRDLSARLRKEGVEATPDQVWDICVAASEQGWPEGREKEKTDEAIGIGAWELMKRCNRSPEFFEFLLEDMKGWIDAGAI